ncbi:MAG: putative 2-aminoethylphosphonate ABC transporter permease subunit [Candidatus Rokuibacteriota bacterium]|nr:MAG: putative 2-aminoethylphosphonate ABC transporter permease subunit [Candidatus Rokubacteria bacterium]
MRAFIGVIGLYLVVALALPLGLMLGKSLQGSRDEFVGLANYIRYFSTPALFQSIGNSLWIAILSTAITVPAAFAYAYALTRTRMPLRGLFKTTALVPILVPSLLPGLALVYLFGNQGLIKGLLLGHGIYGPIGIVMAEAFTTFPHALLIILAALALADARLYEAAVALRASPARIFWTVTLPGARYGLISATFVVFTTVITDFGAPKVIGGQYNVLATDVYKQVIGQQNFQMGAVVSVILLIPAILAFVVDRAVRRRQVALLSARAVPYEPTPTRGLDLAMLAYCTVIGMAILSIVAVSQFAALVKFFPYNLTLTWAHYDFDTKGGGGWASYSNSIRLALLTAAVGTVIVFAGAYLVEKARGFALGRALFHFLAMLPMAVPGLVLGLAYIFFFNAPANPLNVLYRTMTILVVNTVVHFYTVGHLTALTALRQMDPEFETVSASLKQPFYRTFWRVTVPVCLPSTLDIAIYMFVNAMTTVSGVVFIYGPTTELASISVLNMDDTGEIASAAAMAMMIFYTNVAARGLHLILARWLEHRTQAWRRR